MAENVPDRRAFLIGSGSVLLGAALAGCSSKSSSSGANSSSSSTTSSSSSSSAAPSTTSAPASSSSASASATSAPASSSTAIAVPSATGTVSAAPSGAATGPLKSGTYTADAADATHKWQIPLWNKQHPEFQLKVVTENSNQYRAILPQLAKSKDAPSAAGFFIDGSVYVDMVKAGLLAEVSDVWQDGGLNDDVPKLIKDVYTGLAPDGKLYAVPTNCAVYGCLFYSRAALKKAGVAEPVNNEFKDLAEFEAALAAAKKAGLDGISLGGKDGYPLSHLQDAIMASYLTPDEVKDVLNIDYTSDKWLTPVQTMVDWNKKGYYSKGFLGTTADASKTNFVKGKAMFCMAINVWLANLTDAGMKADDIGWVAIPSVGPLPSKVSFYVGGGLIVPNHAPGGPDFAQAKDFVKWAASPAIALENAKRSQVFQGRNNVPGLQEALGPIVGPMFAFSAKPGRVQQGWDDPAPTDMITYDRTNLQTVLAGSLSVKSFGAALQKLRDGHKK